MKIPSIWVTIGKRGFSTEESLRQLLNYNISAIRLNTGRSTFEWIEKTITTLIDVGFPENQILVDIGNTKPRVQVIDGNEVRVANGEQIVLSNHKDYTSRLFLENKDFFALVAKGDVAYFGDGELECRIIQHSHDCVVLMPLSSGVITNATAIGIKEKEWFHFHIEPNQVNQIRALLKYRRVGLILSFVEKADNVRLAKTLFENASVIIPKIETASALNNIDSIIQESSKIFIGRGDLALSVGIEKIGVIQKTLIEKAQAYGCPIALGTGTLDSLKWSQIPLRAEIIDITNTVMSGVDCIVLTSETGGSNNPFFSIEYLSKILNYLSTLQ